MATMRFKLTFTGQLVGALSLPFRQKNTIQQRDWLVFDLHRAVSNEQHDVFVPNTPAWWVPFEAAVGTGVVMGDVLQFSAIASAGWVEADDPGTDSLRSFNRVIQRLTALNQAYAVTHHLGAQHDFERGSHLLAQGRVTFAQYQALQEQLLFEPRTNFSAVNRTAHLPQHFIRFQQKQAQVWRQWQNQLKHLLTPVPLLTAIREVQYVQIVVGDAAAAARTELAQTPKLTKAQRHEVFEKYYVGANSKQTNRQKKSGSAM